ncbi:hypothetical protein C8Q80DRAFT_944181 [Daedaleopsis nitida]|nr:hypothetical protein C8Q80DRAFT_944181 [Daedaleopsis nitida]
MYTEKEREEAWSKAADTVKMYSDEMVARWNREMDTLLVYAGLFSAILTAFNVQSYQLLDTDPNDRLLAALQQISSQLNSFSVTQPFVNSTQQVSSPSSFPPPERSSVWLNVLWFSSLIFSLSAASVGIMVKQWLNEYDTGLSGTSLQTVRLRQYRLNSLSKWHVAEIVAVLPVLLQIALGLFFAGLLILLFTLNDSVAIVAAVLVSILAIFNLITMVLPTFTDDCCYLSPPANAIASLARIVKIAYRRLAMSLDFMLFVVLYRYLGVVRLARWFLAASQHVKNHYQKIQAFTLRDQQLRNVFSNSDDLDADTVIKAYTTTMDPSFLHGVAAIFNDRPSIPMRFFTSVEAFNAQYARWGSDWVTRDMPDEMWSDGVLTALSTSIPHDDSDDRRWKHIHERLRSLRPRDATRGNCLVLNLMVALSSDKYPDPESLRMFLLDVLLIMQNKSYDLEDHVRIHPD